METLDSVALGASVAALVETAMLGQPSEVLGHLRRVVPSFNPDVSSNGHGHSPQSRALSKPAGSVAGAPVTVAKMSLQT